MKNRITSFLFFFFSLTVGMVTPECGTSAQKEFASDELAQQVSDLNTRLQIAGKQNDYPQVEACMDEMIDILQQLEVDEAMIVERAHLRIQYSLTVNRLSSARKAALAWLEQRPDDWIVRDMLGTIAHRMDRDAEAAEALKIVYQADPANPIKQRRYLNMLMLIDAMDEALALCKTVMETTTEDPKTLTEVSEAYLRFGHPQETETVLQRLKSITPDNPYLPYAWGKVFQGKGEFDRAIEQFSRISRNDRDGYDSRFQLGVCLTKRKNYDKAVEAFVDVLTQNPYDINAVSLLQQTLLRLQKKAGGQLLWKLRNEWETRLLSETKAVHARRDGDEIEHARLLAVSFVEKGRYRTAQNLLEDICRRYPESMQAKENLALHFIHTVQARHAESLYHNLLGQVQNRRRDRITTEWVKSLLLQGKTEAAVNEINKTQTGAPLHDSLLSLLGTYYLEIEGNYVQAAACLERISNASPEIRSALARSLLGLGKITQAWSCFELLPSDYKEPLTQMAKVYCLAKMGNSAEAKTLFDQTIQDFPDTSILIFSKAKAALAEVNGAIDAESLQRQAEDADAQLRTISTLVMRAHRCGWPESIPVLLQISDCYNQLGETNEALQYAQLAFEGDPQRKDLRSLVIRRMTDPMHLLERLHHIQTAQNLDPDGYDFAKEKAETLAWIEWTP